MPYSRFWDVTATLHNKMAVWPGDPPFKRVARTKKHNGQAWTNSTLSTGCHVGTHMDAPRHVFKHGGDVNTIPLSTLVGTCRVVEVAGEVIDAGLIAAICPGFGERLLFRTANSSLFSDGEFHEDFVSFDAGAAQALVDAQVVLVGIDGPSVDPIDGPEFPAHNAFCEAGIAVIENLALLDVEPGAYDLICLPMKIDGADGAPVRAILAR
jgi:arylformamidase